MELKTASRPARHLNKFESETEVKNMKANNTSDQTVLIREETIKELQQLAADLGHNPKKSELPPDLHSRVRSVFGKWCYAQEAAGFVVPSERVREKRRKREEHKARVAERQEKREEEKKAREQERRAQAKEKRNSASSSILTYHSPSEK